VKCAHGEARRKVPSQLDRLHRKTLLTASGKAGRYIDGVEKRTKTQG
jgi:hypothetical protein